MDLLLRLLLLVLSDVIENEESITRSLFERVVDDVESN
jgi:hypothetical protein